MLIVERAVKAPACCFVCRHSDGPFVDTFRDFNPGVMTALSGRMYICLACVTRFAAEFGLPEEARAPVEAELQLVLAELAETKLAAEFGERVESLRKELESRLPKKRASRKKKKA